jgi:hypothetical protein
MRRILGALALLVLGGCRTVEIAVDYPLAGVHVVAKFESHEKEAAPTRVASKGETLKALKTL